MSELSTGHPRAASWRATREWLASAFRSGLEERPLVRRELLVVGGLLSLLGLLVLGPYITRGGFYSDDWVHAAWVEYPRRGGIFGLLEMFDSTRYRPGQYIYYPLVQSAFGLHMKVYLAWAALCAVGMSVAFYAFLRFHTMSRLEAGVAAGLVLVFPYSSSSRLWPTGTIVSVTIILYLVGTLVVLKAFTTGSRYRWPLHVLGFALVLAAVMTYEFVAPAVLLSVLLYLRVTSRRVAVVAWLIDVVAVVLTLVFITSGRNQPVGSLGFELHHVRVIAEQGADLWARVLVPYGTTPTRIALGLLIGIAATAIVVALSLPRTNSARRDVLRWLGFLGAGVVFTALAYAMYVPADLYYSPGALGIGDRTNGFATLGWVLIVVALARLAATLVFRDIGGSRIALGVGVLLLAGLVGAGYIDRLRSEADLYAASHRDQVAILGTMVRTLPAPPHGSTIYLARSIPWAGLGVPVFVQPWELFGAVQIVYHDPSLAGYAVPSPSVTLSCDARSVHVLPAGGGYGPPARYGRAFVLDMAAGTTTALDSRATCQRVVAAVGIAPPAAG